MAARKSIKAEKDEGKSYREKLDQYKCLTSAGVFLAGGVRLGEDVFQRVKSKKVKKMKIENNKLKKEKKAYEEKKEKADKILALGLPVDKLNAAQLNILLKLLKRSRADGAIPSNKKGMITKYTEWKNRPAPVFNIDESLSDG